MTKASPLSLLGLQSWVAIEGLRRASRTRNEISRGFLKYSRDTPDVYETSAMSRHVAFLRAINVPGHSKVKMKRLQQAFSSAGCADVKTVIQSGNVLYEASKGDVETLHQRIQEELRELLGREATVLFRRHSEIRDLVKAAPFKAVNADTDVKLYVVLLSQKPIRKPTFPIVSPKESLEALSAKGLEVFVVSRKKENGGCGFPNGFVEKEFEVLATSRNWSTITKIANMSP